LLLLRSAVVEDKGDLKMIITTNSGEEWYLDRKDLALLQGRTGWITKQGYVRTKLNNKAVFVHRILFPNLKKYEFIDHINQNKRDNRRSNLRIVTRTQNNHNHSRKGYCWNKAHKKYMVRIQANKDRKFIGLFKTEEEAQESYKQASLKYHGKYSRFYKGENK
jgi:hypothetical protein